MYFNTSSNYPPKIIKNLPTLTAKRLSKYWLSVKIFNFAKVEYENNLENSWYHSINLNHTKTRKIKPKNNRSQSIIWFNPLYSQSVITNVAKCFLKLLDHHFPKSNKLHKVFNRNTVKVTYSCTENISSIINSHTKKLMKNNAANTKPCNCRTKSTYPLNDQCQTQDIVYKCTVSALVNPDKVY